jgi:hypothetical protein
MEKLFPKLPFARDETPVSWAARLAAFHTGGRLVPFMNDVGIPVIPFARGDRELVVRLCSLADQDPEPVLHNTIVSLGKRRFRLRSQEFSAEFLSRPVTRFCPACLLEDAQGGKRIGSAWRYRLAWCLAPVRTCDRHGLALVERRAGNWTEIAQELQVLIPETEAQLLALAEAQLKRPVSPLQVYVQKRLTGEVGPGWLDDQDIDQASRACEMLGGLLAYGPGQKASELDMAQWDFAGAAGYQVAAVGENAIRDAMAALRKSIGIKEHVARLSGSYGMLYDWLINTRLAKDPGPIRDVLMTDVVDRVPLRVGQKVLGKPVMFPKLCTVRQLAQQEDVDARTLRNLLIAKGVIEHERRHESSAQMIVPRSIGQPIAQEAKTAVSAMRAQVVLGASRPVIRSLIELGWLCKDQGNDLIVSVKSTAISCKSIWQLSGWIKQNVPRTSVVPPDFVCLPKASEKSKVKLKEVLKLMLNKKLHSAVRLPGKAGFDRIRVDPTEVTRHVRPDRKDEPSRYRQIPETSSHPPPLIWSGPQS